ncbi:MAG: hypothetical protein GX335_08645 [Firmicutes bacterium]|nr:hypothetical protein [Bacillota bacterium]
MKKLNAALFVLILCLSLASLSPNLFAQTDEVVATVNGVEITKIEFYELLEKQYGIYALQELIQKELVTQKSAATSIGIADDDFNEFYSAFEQQVGGPQEVQMFLLQNNMTEDQFKEQLRWNLLISELSMQEVEATEKAVTDWFELNRSFYDRPANAEVSHILVDTEEEANEILTALENEEDFAKLAQEKSLDPGSAASGGYLGHVQKGETVPEFEEMIFSLDVGEYGLTESNFGWHIILVHERFPEQAADLTEIYERVKKDYQRDNALDIEGYLEKLEAEADIEILIRSN